jgi:molybdenum cofactor biosynthesis enzyme MoaA
VLFNTNGTLLNEKNGQALIDAGLDELRVSLDAAEPTAFQMVRGKDMFDRIVSNVRRFRQMQQEQNVESPRVSLWLTGLRETLDQLEGFVRIAESVDVREIYLQRLVFFSDNGIGLARAESALFEKTTAEEEAVIQNAHQPRREPWHRLQRLGRHRARHQHQEAPRRFALVALPPPLDADVLHRQRSRASLLHCAVFDARLRQLYPGRRLAADPARNLERRTIPGISRAA